MIFQPYQIIDHDINDEYVMSMFCHNIDNEPVTVNVTGHQPFFYVRVSGHNDISDELTVHIIEHLTKTLKLKSLKFNKERRKELYTYPPVEVDVIKISFPSIEKTKHCYNLINKYKVKDYKLLPIEYMVPNSKKENKPISQVMKFLTEKDMSYTSWMRANNAKTSSLNLSKDLKEYDVNCEDLSLSTETAEIVPSILAFDLETHKHKRYGPADPFNFIASNTIVYTSKGADPVIICQVMATKCSKVTMDGVKIIYYEREIDLIEDFANIINEYNPCMIAQFNGFKFDLPYIEGRLQVNSTAKDKKKMNNISKLRKNDSYWVDKSKANAATSDGGLKIAYFHSPGRINFDIFLYTRLNEPNLPTYKLKDILKAHLGEQKVDLDYEPLNIAIRICNGLSLDKRDEKYKISLIEAVNRECKKTYSMTDWDTQEFRDDTLKAMLIYNIGDTVHLHKLIFKMKAWLSIMEEANIMTIQPMEAHTELQQHKVFPKIYSRAKKSGYFLMIPSWVTTYPYKGGNVYEPIRGKWENVDVLDFASLYPSVIIALNICFSSYVPPGSTIPDDKCHLCKIKDDEGNVIKTHRFIKQEIMKGILPAILEELAVERKRYKKMEADNVGSYLEAIFNMRQLKVKVLMNSIYGLLGMGTGGMCLFEAAEACTAMARKAQDVACQWLIWKGYNVIYGDTDSVFYVKENDTLDDVLNGRGRKNAEAISLLFPKPMSLEYEKTYSICQLEDKKAYWAYLLDKTEPGTLKDKNFKMVGVKEKKRDCPVYIGRVGKELMRDYILRGKKQEECENFMYDKIDEMDQGKHDDELGLVMIYSNKTYARDNDKHSLFNESVRNDGLNVQEGDRLTAFYTVSEREQEIMNKYDPEMASKLKKRLKEKIGNKLRTKEQIIKHGLKLDYRFYAEKIYDASCKHLGIAFK